MSESLVGQPYLEEYLHRRENITALEDILYWTSQEYKRLNEQKGTLQLKKPVDMEKPDRLYSLYTETRQVVENFLQLSPSQIAKVDLSIFDWRSSAKSSAKLGIGISEATYLMSLTNGLSLHGLVTCVGIGAAVGTGAFLSYYRDYSKSAYDPQKRMIVLREKNEAEIVDAIIHGYTCHILNDKTDLLERDSPLFNGHLAGTRMAVGKIMAQNHDDNSLLYGPTQFLVGELKEAYDYVCQQERRIPMNSLVNLDVPTRRNPLWRVEPYYQRSVVPRLIGTAAMAVAEDRQGKQVYAKVVREDYSFLRD